MNRQQVVELLVECFTLSRLHNVSESKYRQGDEAAAFLRELDEQDLWDVCWDVAGRLMQLPSRSKPGRMQYEGDRETVACNIWDRLLFPKDDPTSDEDEDGDASPDDGKKPLTRAQIRQLNAAIDRRLEGSGLTGKYLRLAHRGIKRILFESVARPSE